MLRRHGAVALGGEPSADDMRAAFERVSGISHDEPRYLLRDDYQKARVGVIHEALLKEAWYTRLAAPREFERRAGCGRRRGRDAADLPGFRAPRPAVTSTGILTSGARKGGLSQSELQRRQK